MSHLISFDIKTEIEAVKQEFQLGNTDIVSALQQSLSSELGRDVFVVNDENDSLKIVRLNKNGNFSDVGYKAFKKGRRAFKQHLVFIAKQRQNKKIASMFQPREIVEGIILDSTPNGYFVSTKGERAFFPKENSYLGESNKGIYEIDNKISFEVKKVADGKIYLTRKSLTLITLTIQNIAHRTIKLKLTKKGVLAFCEKPYFDNTQMEIIRASIPLKIIFKKQKEII